MTEIKRLETSLQHQEHRRSEMQLDLEDRAQDLKEKGTVKPVLRDRPFRLTWKLLLTGGCLLLNEIGTESSCSLHYFHAAISNRLSEKTKISCFI